MYTHTDQNFRERGPAMSSTSKALLLLVAGAGGANSLSPMASRPGLAFQGGFAGAAGHGGVLSRRTVPGSAGHRTLLEAKTLRQEGRRAAGGARMMAAPAAAASTGIVKAAVSAMTKTPDALFQSIFVALGATAVLMKLLDRDWSKATKEKEEPAPAGVRSLQARFLIVFWLMRMADWLQGPYFYDVYASAVSLPFPLHLSSPDYPHIRSACTIFNPRPKTPLLIPTNVRPVPAEAASPAVAFDVCLCLSHSPTLAARVLYCLRAFDDPAAQAR